MRNKKMGNNTTKNESPTRYIGDGVYAIFDGYGIWLHANHHKNPTDRIYLEPSVLEGINNFYRDQIENEEEKE